MASAALPAFYHSVDILVLPSLSRPNWIEQFGRVLIEAMACGIPVVGSDTGEIPHVIGEAGLIFPQGDSDALREQLRLLLESSALRRDIGRQGRTRVLAHFTQQQIAESTVRVYEEMLPWDG
jgi:glycosyltransferase involved in cell wall biosynthesis